MSEVIKVNNPLWVAGLSPLVIDFISKILLPNLTYQSLITMFQRTAQIGGNLVELWAVLDNNEPVGFAHWCVRDMPLVGTTHMDFLYCKGNRKDIVRDLVKKWVEFGETHNSPYYMYDVVNNPKLIQHFTNLADELGFEAVQQPYVPFIGRKKNG
jgi:hypothetical protein